MTHYMTTISPARVSAGFGRMSEENIAAFVTAQYERTETATAGAVKEMVVFGAVLESVERRLLVARSEEGFTAVKPSLNRRPPEGFTAVKPSLNGANQTTPKGLTLKGWLEEKCPKVNYSTAYQYLLAARGARKLVRLSEEVPLLALMGEETIPDAELEKFRRKVMKIMETASLRMLRGMGLGKIGRAGERKSYEELRRSEQENAAAAVFPAVWHYMKHRGAIARAVTLLPEEKLTEALATLKEFAGVITEELKSRHEPLRGGTP